MKKVKFLVDPLKISGNTVYMTPAQIKANSSLMVDNNNDNQRVFYKLKDGRLVISVVDYDDKLYLTTLQLQDYLWQSIRGCEEMSNGSKREEYERLTAKAVSLHNAVLKHNYPHDDGSLSEALAKEEDLTILKKIINDKGYYQDLLDSCNEEDRKSVNPVWLDVFGEKVSKELLSILLSKGAVFMSLESLHERSKDRRLHLSYNAISCYLYAAQLHYQDFWRSYELVAYDTHFNVKAVITVAEDMKIKFKSMGLM